MRSLSTRRMVALATTLILATACSDSTAANPRVSDDEATLDLALTAGEAIATDIGLLIAGETDGMSFTAGATRDGDPVRGTAGCTIEGGRRVCSGTSTGTLTQTRSFAFYDAAGAVQTAFDPVTTASINFQMTLNGTVTRPNFSATIARERNMTLSGLAGAETERIWNGTGADLCRDIEGHHHQRRLRASASRESLAEVGHHRAPDVRDRDVRGSAVGDSHLRSARSGHVQWNGGRVAPGRKPELHAESPDESGELPRCLTGETMMGKDRR
jgi:hypothetical protein